MKPRYRVLMSPLYGKLPNSKENETYRNWCNQRGSVDKTRIINDSGQFNYFVKL